MAGDVGLETGVPARLTSADGRRFGLTVGGAFLLLGAVSRWRGHHFAPGVLWGMGGLLVLGGLLFPTRLGRVQAGWMRLALALSRITTPIFMGVVYFLVITPMGLVLRALGRNPLRPRLGPDGYWRRRDRPPDPASLERQF